MAEEQTTQATESTENSDNLGLLAAEVEETTATETEVSHKEETVTAKDEGTTDEQEEDHEWVRPDFWPEQFWDDKEGPDVEKLAKSYQELRTKMSQGKHKPPADGKYDTTIFKNAGVSEDDDLLNKYITKSKELGISQESFEEFAKIYMEEMGQVLDNVATNRTEEIKKLGPKANDILKANNVWLGKLSRTVLNESELSAITKASTSAAFVSALNKIRQASGEQAIPVDAGAVSEGAPSKDDLYAMVGDPRYGKDMVFTRNVENMFVKAFGNNQYSP